MHHANCTINFGTSVCSGGAADSILLDGSFCPTELDESFISIETGRSEIIGVPCNRGPSTSRRAGRLKHAGGKIETAIEKKRQMLIAVMAGGRHHRPKPSVRGPRAWNTNNLPADKQKWSAYHAERQ
jgi:hypothetical protein